MLGTNTINVYSFKTHFIFDVFGTVSIAAALNKFCFDILELNQLPPHKELKEYQTIKENWKFQVKTAIVGH